MNNIISVLGTRHRISVAIGSGASRDGRHPPLTSAESSVIFLILIMQRRCANTVRKNEMRRVLNVNYFVSLSRPFDECVVLFITDEVFVGMVNCLFLLSSVLASGQRPLKPAALKFCLRLASRWNSLMMMMMMMMAVIHYSRQMQCAKY